MNSYMGRKSKCQLEELVAFRHHIAYDKLVQGKCFCARALLEKDYVRKYIEREIDDFRS